MVLHGMLDLDKRGRPCQTSHMTALDLLKSLPLPSRQGRGVGPASVSEKRRWLEAGNLMVNGERMGMVNPLEEFDFPIISVVLFPAGKRVTLW